MRSRDEISTRFESNSPDNNDANMSEPELCFLYPSKVTRLHSFHLQMSPLAKIHRCLCTELGFYIKELTEAKKMLQDMQAN